MCPSFLQHNDDLSETIALNNVTTPYIVGTGDDILHLEQFFIICENEMLPYKLSSFKSAVVTLVACHYVFNIEYPVQTHTLCKFIEKFCLGLSNMKKLSASAVGIISAIERQVV